MSFREINETSITVYSSVKLNLDTVLDGRITVSRGAPVISNCTVMGVKNSGGGGQIDVDGGSPVISGNLIVGGGIMYMEQSYSIDVLIVDNTILNCTYGVSFYDEHGGNVLIEKNLTIDNYSITFLRIE